jgi:putative glutathione S-transferase
MKLMIDGQWRGDTIPTPELDAQRVIHKGLFQNRIEAAAGSAFPAEAGRYHLYVSYACPFAHRTLMARALLRLEDVIGVSILHPVWNTPDGWVFSDATAEARGSSAGLATLDRAGNGFTHLHQAYSASQPDYTGKVTVPVLWDTKTRQIVSNESADIVLMLNEAFASRHAMDLYPVPLRPEIDSSSEAIRTDLAAGVYAVGGARNQAEYDTAMDRLFGLLDALELQLAEGRRFLHGEQVTLTDILAFTPLIRFDTVYNPLFRASRKRLVDYPRLSAYTARVYGLPGVAETVKFDHIMVHYHDGDWGVANRVGIVPELPAVDFRSRNPAPVPFPNAASPAGQQRPISGFARLEEFA